jgi:hypothetical protein
MSIQLTYRMRPIRYYRIVLEKLRKKRLYASMMRRHQLAFGKRCDGYTTGGGWLTFHKEKWYFVTWYPQAYLICAKQDIPALCKEFMSYKMIGLSTPSELVTKYRLKQISWSEMEAIFQDQDRSGRNN